MWEKPTGDLGKDLMSADSIDTYPVSYTHLDVYKRQLMGMARSAGNLATEVCAAIMQRCGQMQDIDLYGLLEFIETRLEPAMAVHGYHNPISPLDLVLGLSGCHSSFVKKFKTVSEETGVSLFRLIVAVSAQDQKSPSEDLIRQTAEQLH